MILTQCACCAAPLPHLAKQCSRCKTRYCGPACQAQHWKDGGHDKRCKKIRKGGGAELYNADQKYKEAVAVAVEKCTEDTKGQTCYICTEAVHRRTKEGLVRGCACHTTEGFVHVSCLAEQAKILVADAEERNSDDGKWPWWSTCSLCEQSYHGVVMCALSWACWKTYVDRPETDRLRISAMSNLGNGLSVAGHHEDALSVKDVELFMLRRIGATEDTILTVQGNLASTYQQLGLKDQALRLRRDVYAGKFGLYGEEHESTLLEAYNYASSLLPLQRSEEAKSLMLKTIPVARRALGDSNDITLRMRSIYAAALYQACGATLDDLREAVTTLAETKRTARRVLGGAHPLTSMIEQDLRNSRATLRAREAPSSASI